MYILKLSRGGCHESKKSISLCCLFYVGRKASRSWLRQRWVLLPPQHLHAAIPPPLLAVPHFPTVRWPVFYLFSPFTSSFFFSGNNLLTLVPGAKAHNQFFPLYALIRPLPLKQMVFRLSSAYFFFMFLIDVFLWSDSSQLRIYCGLFGCFFFSEHQFLILAVPV